MGSRGARFGVGEVVQHRLFEYRGVIADVDATFQLSDEWYEEMARSSPPKDAPWYHVLVHDAEHMTYVAERNLESDPAPRPIQHPLLDHYFAAFEDGRYRPAQRVN